MNQFRVSAAARADLDDLWVYIAHDNVEAADKFIQLLVDKFPKRAGWPEIGRQREELSPRLRSLAAGQYVIFYRPLENGIEIVRVLHGARDLPPQFE